MTELKPPKTLCIALKAIGFDEPTEDFYTTEDGDAGTSPGRSNWNNYKWYFSCPNLDQITRFLRERHGGHVGLIPEKGYAG